MRGLLIPDAPAPTFDSSQGWQMHPRVALRPEPFGAMAYHYGNRRLNFLRSHDLVAIVEDLPNHADVDAALAASDVSEDRWPSFRRALAALAASDFLVPTPAHAAHDRPAHHLPGETS